MQEFYNNGGQGTSKNRVVASLCSQACRYDNPIPTWFLSFLYFINRRRTYNFNLFKVTGDTKLKNWTAIVDYIHPLGLALPVLKNGKDRIRTCFFILS